MQEDIQNGVSVLTVKEAAAKLGISERAVWNRIKAGKLKKIPIDGRTYIEASSLHSSEDASGNASGASFSHQEVFSSELQCKVDALQEIVRRQDSEIEYLRRQTEAQLVTLNRLSDQLTLPAPQSTQDTSSPSSPTQYPRRNPWPWIFAAAVLIISGASIYAMWYLGG